MASRFERAPVGVGVVAATLLACALPVSAQNAEDVLTPGDVVRIDEDVVGTLLSIEEARLTVLAEGKPRCWPGISHGEAPRCDPVPTVRHVVDWRTTTVERQLAERSYTKRTIVGILVGAAVGGPFGYLTGPGLGYGKIDACVEAEIGFCPNPIPAVEAESRQRAQDQRRGAFFFGLLGATGGAILARTLADEWVEVEPPAMLGGAEPWSVGVRLPLSSR